MSEILIKQDKTFFVMKGGEVYTFFKTRQNEHGLQLLVYDRSSMNGYNVLDTEKVNMILTEYSQEYNRLLKNFIIFISNDLKDNPFLAKFILAIWSEDYRTSDECYWDDVSLDAKFIQYLEQLIERNVYDNNIVRYFYEVHCLQEVTYPKFNIEWYRNNIAER